ncbi:MAG: hypothetical protein ABH872_02150 [Candidatus Omnitrophota bacterium]
MKQKKKSFTLSEVLLAAVILAVSFCALLLVFITSALLNASSRGLTVAMTHAQYIMEEVKNTNFSQIKTDINNNVWDLGVSDIESRGLSPLNSETIDTEVTGTALLDITVTVNWQERSGRNMSTAIETLIAQP